MSRCIPDSRIHSLSCISLVMVAELQHIESLLQETVSTSMNLICVREARFRIIHAFLGLEWKNPDLAQNYNADGSFDLNSNDADPSPSSSKDSNHHGTRCAGEIAAVANNGVCGVGVAYQARISGIRILDGPMTDDLEAVAFTKKLDVNDVYSCRLWFFIICLFVCCSFLIISGINCELRTFALVAVPIPQCIEFRF